MRSNAMERFFGRLLVAEERLNDAHGTLRLWSLQRVPLDHAGCCHSA